MFHDRQGMADIAKAEPFAGRGFHAQEQGQQRSAGNAVGSAGPVPGVPPSGKERFGTPIRAAAPGELDFGGARVEAGLNGDGITDHGRVTPIATRRVGDKAVLEGPENPVSPQGGRVRTVGSQPSRILAEQPFGGFESPRRIRRPGIVSAGFVGHRSDSRETEPQEGQARRCTVAVAARGQAPSFTHARIAHAARAVDRLIHCLRYRGRNPAPR